MTHRSLTLAAAAAGGRGSLGSTKPRALILAAALVVAMPGHARATIGGGINLSWDDCGAFGTQQKNFACDTNSGVGILYVSAIAPTPLPYLVGAGCVVDLQTNQPTLSPWWMLQSTGCRGTSLSASYDFTGGPLHCLDAWKGLATSGFTYSPQYLAPNWGRIRTFCIMPSSDAVAVDAVTEMYVVSIAIDHARTVGAGACAGCMDGACIIAQYVVFQQSPGPYGPEVNYPIQRRYVTWQPGGAFIGSIACPASVTPARNATWGAIKSLYR